jgi:hypothetical protein
MSCEHCSCNSEPNIKKILGEKGDNGFNGWSPLFAVAEDGERRVLKIVDWTGGTGTKPSFTNQYLGPAGIVEEITDGNDIRGEQGAAGAAGAEGEKGWSPVLAVVADGERYVFQIVDWQGGEGDKPSTTNQFIGAIGIVSSAGAAVDIRGPQGEQGEAGTSLPDPTGQDGKILGVVVDEYALVDAPEEIPAITANTRRILREKPNGSGAEWYTVFHDYVRIPMVANGIFSSTTSFVTLRNSESTVFLKTALPNDGTIRKIFVIASLSLSSSSPDTSNCMGHFAIRDITNNTTLTDDQIETAYRKNPSFHYIGTFTCNGQEIGIQWKHDSGQFSSSFIGGHISLIEIP